MIDRWVVALLRGRRGGVLVLSVMWLRTETTRQQERPSVTLLHGAWPEKEAQRLRSSLTGRLQFIGSVLAVGYTVAHLVLGQTLVAVAPELAQHAQVLICNQPIRDQGSNHARARLTVLAQGLCVF